jgi:serine/threonine protein kinase
LSNVSGDQREIVEYCGIVMEKGEENLLEYLDKGRQNPLTDMQRFALAENVVDIVIEAHRQGIVLMDLKPSNFVRVKVDSDYVLKAIDFDNSVKEGDHVSRNITPAYCSYEMARFVLDKDMNVMKASKAMDVCSLGWTVWKILKGTTLWTELNIADNDKILEELSRMDDEDVSIRREIERTFPSLKSVQSFLLDALHVNPRSRMTAFQLKNNHSMLKGGDSTINIDSLGRLVTQVGDKVIQHIDDANTLLLSHIDESNAVLLNRMDEISQQMVFGFSSFETQLDDLALSSRSDAEDTLFLFNKLEKSLGALKSSNDQNDSNKVQQAIAKSIEAFEQSIQVNINTSLLVIRRTSSNRSKYTRTTYQPVKDS